MTPVSKACAHCGKEQTYTTAWRPYRCRDCKALMDWRQPLTCKNCQFISEISPIELQQIDKKKCPKCRIKLSWSISPELYTPNEVPLKARLIAFILTAFMAGLALHMAITNHTMLLYGNRLRRVGVHFDGHEVIAPMIAFILYSLGMITIIVDHYDKRLNEYQYQLAIKAFCGLGTLAYFTAPVIKLIN